MGDHILQHVNVLRHNEIWEDSRLNSEAEERGQFEAVPHPRGILYSSKSALEDIAGSADKMGTRMADEKTHFLSDKVIEVVNCVVVTEENVPPALRKYTAKSLGRRAGP